MLPLLRDELRVQFSPTSLVLLRLGWTSGRRGLMRRVMTKRILECQPAAEGSTSWDAAMQLLDQELPQIIAPKTTAKIVLSGHLVRYAMVPWSDALSEPAEEEAYARHCFSQLYGAAAANWELRLSSQGVGMPQLASAVDSELLTTLRGVFKRHGVTLKSMQPQLMATYNSHHDLHHGSAWLVVHEPGSLCLALLQNGQFCRVRTLRDGSDWRETLLLALQREAYMAEENDAVVQVYVWAPGVEMSELPQGTSWQFQALHAQQHARPLSQSDDRIAMALDC